MELLLENTSYEDFDDWMQNFAKRKRILLSYDSTGIAHSLEVSPRRGVKRIFIAKTSSSGIAFDHECYFTLRKAGNNLQVFPGVVKGPNITASTALLELIILEVQWAWGLKVDQDPESYHHKYPKNYRKMIAEKYRSDKRTIGVENQDTWAAMKFEISGRTLRNYLNEFPE